MADYININGNNIPIRASDPSNPIVGEIWYNSTTNLLKGQGLGAASWATGGSLSTGRYNLAGAGTQTAGLAWGGRDTPIYNVTEEYNGTSWTGGGNYPKNIASHGGTGSQTAALSVGGLNPAAPPGYSDSFEYNGTSWANPASIGRQGFGMRVSGTQTSAVATGGGSIGGPEIRNTADTELYDGTSWTAGNPFSTARSFHSTGGVNQTASIIVGGRTGTSPNEAATTAVEEYDGTSWAAGTVYPTTIKESAGWGTTTDFIQAGGSVPPATTACNIYDGTSWTSTVSMPSARSTNATSQGTYNTQSGLVFGGIPPSNLTTTEEFTGPGPVTQTISNS
jgi:hypothetical protein